MVLLPHYSGRTLRLPIRRTGREPVDAGRAPLARDVAHAAERVVGGKGIGSVGKLDSRRGGVAGGAAFAVADVGTSRRRGASGAAAAIGQMATSAHLPPLVFGWVCAALVRVATGSATVAITTASGLVAPLVLSTPGVNPELVVVGIGCGSLFLSHLNDAGFWIVKECLGLTVSQTLRTWTVTETLVGVTGLFVAWGLDSVF